MMRVVTLSLMILVFLSTTLIQIPGVFATNSVSMGNLITGTALTTTPNLITVDLSNQCLALIKMNNTKECPTYKTLAKHDNSNQVISGKIVTKNGFTYRETTKSTNHWTMYPPGKLIVMIDPDYNALVHSKEITIVPSLYYAESGQTVGSNHTMIVHTKRITNPSCTSAKIVYSEYLLEDTINYLSSNCTKTSFNEMEKVSVAASTPIILNSPFSSTQYDNQLKTIFHGFKQLHNEKMPTIGGLGPGNCIGKTICPFTTSTKKW